MPQIAFGFPTADRMLTFQNDRKDGALQGKQKKHYHMNKASATVYDLPTAKVDTGYKPIDRKDKQTILPAKPSYLSGKHTDRLLQVWITGKQRTDWSV